MLTIPKCRIGNVYILGRINELDLMVKFNFADLGVGKNVPVLQAMARRMANAKKMAR